MIRVFGLLIAAVMLAASAVPALAQPGFFGLQKSQKLNFESIGLVQMPVTTWSTGRTFSNSSVDGGFQNPRRPVVDTANGFIYLTDLTAGRVIKLSLSTGAFIGAIGRVTSSTGTCTVPTATGWCTGGSFTTGTDDGQFGSPNSHLTLDSTGTYLYVSDGINQRIQKFNASTGAFIGAIGALAGAGGGTCPASGVASGWCTKGIFDSNASSAMGGFYNPTSIAESGGFLYVTDGAHRVIKINASTGATVGAVGRSSSASGTCPSGNSTTWCSGTAFTGVYADGAFNGPADIVVSGSFFYVADSRRITKHNLSNGTFVGAIGGLSGASTGTCPASGAATTWCTGGAFNTGTGDGYFSTNLRMGVDATNDRLYMADTNRVTKYVLSTGAFVGAIGAVSSSTGTCTTGAATGWCTGGSFGAGTSDGTFTTPTGVGVDPAGGFIYVSEFGSKISKINSSTGAFVGAIGYQSAPANAWGKGRTYSTGSSYGAFSKPTGVAAANGFLYVVDKPNHRIVKINEGTGAAVGAIGKVTFSTGTCPAPSPAPGWCTGGVFGSGQGDGVFNSPNAIAVDPVGGFLYVADGGTTSPRVVKINLATGAFIGATGKVGASTGTCVAGVDGAGWCTGGSYSQGGTDGAMANVVGIAIDTVNDWLFTAEDSPGFRVSKYTLSTGAYIGSIGRVGSTSAGATCAVGIPNAWCKGGLFQAAFPPTNGAFTGVKAIAVNPATQRLYVTNDAQVDLFNANTGAYISSYTTVDGSGGLFVSQKTNELYVANRSNSVAKIVKLNLTTGTQVGMVGNMTASTGNCPASGPASFWCTGGTTSSVSHVDGALMLPACITRDMTSGFIYVCDNNNRIQRFR